MLLNTCSSHSKYFLKGNFTQFSFPSLCVLLEGNIKMVEAEDGEIVYNEESVKRRVCKVSDVASPTRKRLGRKQEILMFTPF